MGRKCVVPFCKSGYDSCPEKVSMFSVPKNKLEDWQKAIGRTDLSLTPRHTVCEKHFRKKDIIREVKTEVYTYPLLIPKLSENAIPRIFPKKYEFRSRIKKHSSSIITFKKINSAMIKNMKKQFSTTQEQLEVTSRDEFMEKLKENRENCSNTSSLSKQVYDELITDIIQAVKTRKKATSVQRLKKLYDIIQVDGIIKLIVPRRTGKDIQIYIHDEEIFDILQITHISLNHGGAHKMMTELKKMYKNICFNDVITYISLCPRCSNKKIVKKKVVKGENRENGTKYCTEFSTNCHVNILDYQSNPDNEYKFILIYQNNLTKYCLLRPLKSKASEDIYTELSDIFAFHGVPATINSKIENDLMKDVIKKINLLPELQIAYIKCENDDNTDCTEDVNEHLENWMERNGTKQWINGLHFIQLMINQDYYKDIHKAPNDTLFMQSTNDMEESMEKLNKFSGNIIKEENVEIFSCVCEGCGNDIGNEQTCPICQNVLPVTFKNEINQKLINIKKEASF